jgi:hypothetical protein
MIDAILDRGPELSPLLTAMTDRLMGDPWERWRAKVASSRPLGVDEDRLIDDPVVAGLARQRERAWLTALASVWRADRAVALDLVDELARVIDIGDEGGGGAGGAGAERVPMWTTDAALLDDLLGRLTDASATDASVLSAARAFLAMRGAAGGAGSGVAAGGALVMDDAGVLDPDGRPLPALWAINFGATPASVSVRSRGSEVGIDAQEPVSLPPRTARRVYAGVGGGGAGGGGGGPPPPPRAPPAGGGSELAVRVGEWSSTRTVIGQRVRVVPPGLRIGPMLADWSMAEAGEQAMVRPGRAGTGVALPRADPAFDAQGRLYREPGGGGGGGVGGDRDAGRGVGGSWTVYMECRRPAGVSGSTDRLTLWFGPAGAGGSASAATLSVTDTGEITWRVGGGRGGPAMQGAGTARVTRLSDRWIVWIPVPPAVIERAAAREGGASGVVQIGVVREDARGVRTAWPRPMLPWSTEPGRVASDLSAWGVE